MKRITAIAIVAVALLGSSYVGAAPKNCVDVGYDLAEVYYGDFTDKGKNSMAVVFTNTCETGRWAAIHGTTHEQLDVILEGTEQEFRDAVTLGYSLEINK